MPKRVVAAWFRMTHVIPRVTPLASVFLNVTHESTIDPKGCSRARGYGMRSNYATHLTLW